MSLLGDLLVFAAWYSFLCFSSVFCRAFFREFRRVVDESDVLLEVLDARDPIACRCKAVEQAILEKGKKIVLILNKIDLVPREVCK